MATWYWADSVAYPYKLARIVAPDSLSPDDGTFLKFWQSTAERWNSKNDSWYVIAELSSDIAWSGEWEPVAAKDVEKVKRRLVEIEKQSAASRKAMEQELLKIYKKSE